MRDSLDSDFTVNSVILLSKNRGLLLFTLTISEFNVKPPVIFPCVRAIYKLTWSPRALYVTSTHSSVLMRKNLVIRSSVRRIPCWWSWNEHKNTLEHSIKWCGGLRRWVHTRTHKYRAQRDSHQSNKRWEGLFAFFSSSRLVAQPNPFSQQVFDLQNKLTKIYESVHTNEDTTVKGCPTDTDTMETPRDLLFPVKTK